MVVCSKQALVLTIRAQVFALGDAILSWNISANIHSKKAHHIIWEADQFELLLFVYCACFISYIPVKREPHLRNCLYRNSLWEGLRGIFLIANWCRRAQPPVEDGPIPGQVFLGCVRGNEPECVGQEVAFLQALCWGPCPEVLLWLPWWWPVTCNPGGPFLFPSSLWSIENKLESFFMIFCAGGQTHCLKHSG